jgi:hypothetical protein
MPRSALTVVALCGALFMHEPAARADNAPAVGLVAATLPAICAEYRMTSTGRRDETLTLLRSERLIEHRFAAQKRLELWERDARGQLGHAKVFPLDNRLVRYVPGDLRALGVAPSWHELATLVQADFKDKFQRKPGTERFAQEQAQLYERRADGERTRLFWLERLSLPLELERQKPGQRVSLKLVSVKPGNTDACAATPTRGLTELDFADLGDRESDPWVRRFIASFGQGTHRHEHISQPPK